jgi:ubiquinone/menaquinone biosynthesis C-methylase UbiE
MKQQVLKQKTHYEKIHERYEDHYFDADSMSFREQFIYDVMFDGLDLNGKEVADLAAGSGYNSLWVQQRFPRARLCGFDISEKACASYRELLGTEAHVFDLTSGQVPASAFDLAMIFGGLHHCVSDLPGTIRTIAQLVRPGGLLLMFEPNSQYFLQFVRKIWYRFDSTFERDTESALDHNALSVMAAPYFQPLDSWHMGGPAYFLIYNSMIFRLPKTWKRSFVPILFPLERAYNRVPGRFMFPYFIARWRRLDSPAAELPAVQP